MDSPAAGVLRGVFRVNTPVMGVPEICYSYFKSSSVHTLFGIVILLLTIWGVSERTGTALGPWENAGSPVFYYYDDYLLHFTVMDIGRRYTTTDRGYTAPTDWGYTLNPLIAGTLHPLIAGSLHPLIAGTLHPLTREYTAPTDIGTLHPLTEDTLKRHSTLYARVNKVESWRFND